MPAQSWILKTEPSTYSFQQLIKDRKTAWNGIRNFQARNNLKLIQPGDWLWIYHSGDERAIVGSAQAEGQAYPENDPKRPGDWLQIDIAAAKACKGPVTLAQLKSTPGLRDMKLVKQSRLSVCPVTPSEHAALLKFTGLG